MSEETTEASTSPQRLDPEGDAVLVIGEYTPEFERKFLVSSKVLSLASPVFAKLFSDRFSEGIEVRKGSCPEIELPEDDPDAMEVILKVFHFLTPRDINPLDLEFIAKVTVCSNKYDCVKPLSTWLSRWLHDPQLRSHTRLSAIDYGHLLFSAFLSQDQDSFSHFSIKAQFEMTPDDFNKWEESEEAEMLQSALFPTEIADTLAGRIEEALGRFFKYLQDMEERFHNIKGGHLMDFKYCPECERTHPVTAKKCHTCGISVEGTPKYCNNDSRVSLYVTELRRAGLRPTSRKEINACRATELLEKLLALSKSCKHSCQAGPGCPLKLALSEHSIESGRAILDVQGLQLSDFQ